MIRVRPWPWSRDGVFCRAIDKHIPSGSRVFVSVFPDVYLCFSQRTDLTFRSFVPERLPVATDTYRRVIDESDIIVTGRWSPGSPAEVIARRQGQLVAEVGSRSGDAYHALIYRMRKAAEQ